ncbi:MAG: DUF2061 domain-containing protein [Limisphaerales bacterium]
MQSATPASAQGNVAGAGGERHWRSVAKAISWRAIGTIDTMVISFIITGKVKLAVSIGCVELFTKIGLFYVHERAWHRIPYGRVPDRTE